MLQETLETADRPRHDTCGSAQKDGHFPCDSPKMSKGEAIGANVLERICATMQCDVGDVMTYVPAPADMSKGKKVVSR